MPAKPLDIASSFDSTELFFSRTDTHGTILAGNQVFARVGEYSRVEMIGKPHNLIRHPDVPKAVFKVLWDGLLKNEVTAAYVKNMSSSGKYYWVLATVFPVEGGFISIRIKPGTPLFEAAKSIYADTLVYEKKHGMDAAYLHLLETLKNAGFANYPAFMREALNQELDLHLSQLHAEAQNEVDHRDRFAQAVHQSKKSIDQSSELLKTIFQRMLKAEKQSKSFVTLAQTVSGSYRTIHRLSVNMIAEAERIGEKGRTLTIISETFSKWAKDIQTHIEHFSHALQQVADELSQLIFSISTTELQAEMVGFFMQEYFNHHDDEAGQSISREELESNCAYFFSAPETVFQEVFKQLDSLAIKVTSLERANEDLRYSLNALKMIRQNGRIETSRLSDAQQGFNHHLEGMHGFIQQVEQVSERIRLETQELKTSAIAATTDLNQVQTTFKQSAEALKSPLNENH